jgi:hypothetical protein
MRGTRRGRPEAHGAMRAQHVVTILLGCCFLGAAPAWVPSQGVGDVHMPISCASVQTDFDHGLALLHSFWYDRALAQFDAVIAADPQCQIAYWGAAMTWNHPLWGPPSRTDLQSAHSYLTRGAAATEHSDREAQYFQAVTTLLGDTQQPKGARDAAYRDAMAKVYAAFPDDETALFYALSIEGAPGYRQDPKQIELAGSLAEGVHARQPHHPGALHYTIHAYDEPGYEERALTAARAYAASAPAIPHALHMPSHTFLALGLWQEANRTNRNAFAASEASVRLAGQHPYDRDFHTLWFLVYGDLQAGEAREARKYATIARDEYLSELKLYPTMPAEQADDTFDTVELAGALLSYSFETGDYSFARVVTETGLPSTWLAFRAEAQAFDAIAARDTARAKAARDAVVAAARAVPVERKAYKLLTEIAAAEVDAKLALARGDKPGGLNALRTAAEAENELRGAGAAVPQPIEIPPANEMYGLELLRQGHYGEAATALTQALVLTPGRPRAVAGLAQAHANF